MTYTRQIEPHRYSVSLVKQGKHRFYTLTLPSDVLANTCFVRSRDEDPHEGFQRVLDGNRAQEIANYVDLGFGTIPTSIVLSAQPSAELKVVGKGKTLEFKDDPKAFLILDGQHRVYGFSLAKTSLRVPVVIYNNLTPRDESRLFIDINTKQRPVPNELLLDIKKLAEYENQTENLLGEIFDLFNSDASSPLLGLLSPHERASNKISRVTFNAGLKQLLGVFADSDPDAIYKALSSFLSAFMSGAEGIKAPDIITKPTVFRAVMMLFPEAAQRVKDKYGKAYTRENFDEILSPMFIQIRPGILKQPSSSQRDLYKSLSDGLKTSFVL
jgi:DGQHR domain-containing protein